MAILSITVPDAQVPRIVAAVAKIRGVDVSAMTVPQKAAFLKSDVRDYWVDVMIQAEVPAVAETAAAAARTARLADIAANVTVT